MESNRENLLRRHFEIYRNKKDVFSGDWVIDYFDRRGATAEMDLEYSNETDSGNYSCGEEAEMIYSQMIDAQRIYWILTSTGGPRGPFLTADEAIEALGYYPRNLKRRKGWLDNRK